MNYLEISHCNMVNGDGLRTVLWVAGCSHRCKGCQNAFSQNPSEGIKFDEDAKAELFKDLTTDWCAGVTFSGGDPLFEGNRAEVIALAKEIKEKFPAKNIWLYTGYCWNDILNDPTMSEVIKHVDVICDGPYIESQKDVNLHWVGSTNQHVINVKERIKKIVSLMNMNEVNSTLH